MLTKPTCLAGIFMIALFVKRSVGIFLWDMGFSLSVNVRELYCCRLENFYLQVMWCVVKVV